jgi:glyoxylase-like metal-dependent hydrolase (beta-lactamase superfamily II)
VQSEKSSPIISVVTSTLFEENAYLIAGSERGGDCFVVDPGLEPERIIEEMERRQWALAAILNTHGHADHIAGNAALKARWPEAPLIIGTGDASKLTDPVGNLSAGFGLPLVSPEADRTVIEGELLEFCRIRWTVYETPGHSSGHVVFIAEELSPVLVLGGDVLFAGSVGRTDFPDSDPEALVRSIREKLFVLPDETVVLPGHGPPTTVGREKRFNPFVGAGAASF